MIKTLFVFYTENKYNDVNIEKIWTMTVRIHVNLK